MREKFVPTKDIIINNIKFTSRKIDILSCICNGYSSKTISNLLGISINTVNTHIKHMFEGTDSYSRDQLKQFCQRSKEYAQLQNRYNETLLFNEFEQILRKIKKLQLKEKYIFHVIGETNIDDSVLITSMKLAGIDIHVFYNNKIELKNEYTNIICLEKNAKSEKLKIKNKVLFIDKNELTLGNCSDDKFFTYVSALKSILPCEANGIFQELEDYKNQLYKANPSLNKRFSMKIRIISLLVMIIISFFGTLVYFDQKDVVMSNLYYASSNTLVRIHLLEEINKAVKNSKNDIKTIVLVGRGGAGKTTIARNFINDKSVPIKWEINAESKQTIVDSFYDLATVVAEKQNKQEALSNIKSTSNPTERTKRIMLFIQSYLKQRRNWCLLFDNVDELGIVKEYFPINPEIWGSGVALITTRNTNIGNSVLFSSTVVPVGELSSDEQYQLFCGILYGSDRRISPEETVRIKDFLSNIPMFPLDVSSAAYYIKNTKIKFDDYLSCVNSFSEDFENMNQKIVFECLSYDKTRNGIIASIFSRIVQENPEFKKLLLLICLVDSQNINIRFLEKYKDKVVAQEFMHVLRKFSIITEKDGAFSIHRSTQEIGLRYILSTLSENEKMKYIDAIVKIMTPFEDICWFMYKKGLDEYKEGFFVDSIPHLNALVNSLEFVCAKDSEKYKARIFVALGHIYYIDGTMVSMTMLNYKKAMDMKEIRKYMSTYDYAVLLAMCGHNSMLIGEMDTAKKQLDECYSISKTLSNNEALLSMSLTLLSTLQERIGNFEKAEEISSEAIKILENHKEKWSMFILVQAYYFAVCHHARRYLREQKNDLCIAYAQKIFDIYDNKQLSCKQMGNSSSERYPTFACFAKNMLAMYFNMLGKYKVSLKEYSIPNEAIMKKFKESDVPLSHKVFLESEKNYSLLWLGQHKLAEEKLSDAIEKLRYLDNSKLLIYAIFYRIEARIILEKLKEAYEDCKFAIDFKRWNQDNTSVVRRNTCHYHAAIIKYKQHDHILSLQHFSDFFETMNEFCKGFLEKSVYEKLLSENVFEIIQDKSQVTTCLQNSLKIFSAIYGENHSFVKDYVYKNQN